MVLSINNNSLSSGLLSGLNKAQDRELTALQRIGSGKKVNSAADNAAAVAIIERFAAQITGFGQSIRNSSDGISFTQVADAGLSTISDDIQRIRELSIQSANGSLTDGDRATLQSEVVQLQQGIGQSIDRANFNGVDIFKTDAVISFQVGASADDSIDLSTQNLADDFTDFSSIDISTQAGAQSALADIDAVLQTVTEQRVNFGAIQNRLESSITDLENNRVNTIAARSRMEDADIAREVSEQIKGSIQQQSGIAVQSLANSSAELVLRLLS